MTINDILTDFENVGLARNLAQLHLQIVPTSAGRFCGVTGCGQPSTQAVKGTQLIPLCDDHADELRTRIAER